MDRLLDILTMLLEMAGVVLLVIGAAQIYSPLGWIIAGVALIGIAVLADVRWGRR